MPMPHVEQDWPAEPFRSGMLASLRSMEMPRFCRRHPQLLDPLMKQLLGLVHVRTLLGCNQYACLCSHTSSTCPENGAIATLRP